MHITWDTHQHILHGAWTHGAHLMWGMYMAHGAHTSHTARGHITHSMQTHTSHRACGHTRCGDTRPCTTPHTWCSGAPYSSSCRNSLSQAVEVALLGSFPVSYLRSHGKRLHRQTPPQQQPLVTGAPGQRLASPSLSEHLDAQVPRGSVATALMLALLAISPLPRAVCPFQEECLGLESGDGSKGGLTMIVEPANSTYDLQAREQQAATKGLAGYQS